MLRTLFYFVDKFVVSFLELLLYQPFNKLSPHPKDNKNVGGGDCEHSEYEEQKVHDYTIGGGSFFAFSCHSVWIGVLVLPSAFLPEKYPIITEPTTPQQAPVTISQTGTVIAYCASTPITPTTAALTAINTPAMVCMISLMFFFIM
jgi:hypothetical protein